MFPYKCTQYKYFIVYDFDEYIIIWIPSKIPLQKLNIQSYHYYVQMYMYLFVAIAIYDKRAKSVNIRNFKVLIFHPILMLCKIF